MTLKLHHWYNEKSKLHDFGPKYNLEKKYDVVVSKLQSRENYIIYFVS